MARRQDFDETVKLPPGLTITAIRKSVEYIEREVPDPRHRGKGAKAPPKYCLESKGSIRAWVVQSHYDHEGWYIIWRYLVDPTLQIEPNRPIIVWRTDVVYLQCEDWKYEGSKAGSSGGGRTHTFGVARPATRLKGCQVYRRGDIVISGGKPVPINGD